MTMPTNRTKLELVLFFLVAVTLLASIAMCICLFLILPTSWTNENYVYDEDGNYTTLMYKCKCRITNVTSIGYYKENSFSRKDDSQLDASFSRNKIRFFPYLVSLSIPSYVDELGEMKFACSGVIVAKNWVLTGEKVKKVWGMKLATEIEGERDEVMSFDLMPECEVS